MSGGKNPVAHMLNLALASAADHYQYYHNAAMNVELPQVKALLLILSEVEGELIDKIRDMMATGIVEEIEEVAEFDITQELPDETPFDLHREDTDPRIYICNRALEKELKALKFFISIAGRARSEVISRLFQYFAHVKLKQIRKIRRACGSF